MRLIPRPRNRQRSAAARIEISQAEITADLHYPLAVSRSVQRALDTSRRGGGR
jgi:formate-dependent nitrite reductase cytochrome c552 subunit